MKQLHTVLCVVFLFFPVLTSNAYILGGSSDQVQPAVARSASSYIVVAEHRYQSDFALSTSIQYRLYDTSGNPLGSYQVISSSNYYANPVVECNGDNYLIAWASKSKEIMGQFVSLTGEKIGSPFVIETNSLFMGFPNKVEIASDGFDYFVIYDSSYHSTNLYGRIVTSATSIGDRITISGGNFVFDYSIDSNRYPYSATYRTYLITWSEYPYNGGYYNIYGALYSPTGTPIVAKQQINQNSQYSHNYPNNVSVGCNGYNYLVAWDDKENNSGIKGRSIISYYPDGSSLYFYNNEFQVSQNTSSEYELFPSVSAGDGWKFLVTWQTEDVGGFNIYGRFIYYYGSAYTNEFRLNAQTQRDQQCPAVIGDGYLYQRYGDANYLAVWQSNSNDMGYDYNSKFGYDIFGGLYSVTDMTPKDDPSE